jgi:hypothetical protein
MTVVVLNDGFTTRTSASGRSRTTVEVKSEPLVHNLDPKQLGQGVADAIAQHFRDRIAGITARASDATIRARQNAAKGPQTLATARRYGGGRLGPMPPNQSDRLFNDSGRLVQSIVARATSAGEWVINVAANRLDEQSFGQGFAAMLQRLASFVPEIADPRLLMDSIPVRRAVENGMKQMIQKQEARISELRDTRAKAIINAGLGLLRLVG